MIKIKAKEKNGVITYKNGRKREAEIYVQTSGEFKGIYCSDKPITKTSSVCSFHKDLETAKLNAESYLNGIHSFVGGVEVEYV